MTIISKGIYRKLHCYVLPSYVLDACDLPSEPWIRYYCSDSTEAAEGGSVWEGKVSQNLIHTHKLDIMS